MNYCPNFQNSIISILPQYLKRTFIYDYITCFHFSSSISIEYISLLQHSFFIIQYYLICDTGNGQSQVRIEMQPITRRQQLNQLFQLECGVYLELYLIWLKPNFNIRHFPSAYAILLSSNVKGYHHTEYHRQFVA